MQINNSLSTRLFKHEPGLVAFVATCVIGVSLFYLFEKYYFSSSTQSNPPPDSRLNNTNPAKKVPSDLDNRLVDLEKSITVIKEKPELQANESTGAISTIANESVKPGFQAKVKEAEVIVSEAKIPIPLTIFQLIAEYVGIQDMGRLTRVCTTLTKLRTNPYLKFSSLHCLVQGLSQPIKLEYPNEASYWHFQFFEKEVVAFSKTTIERFELKKEGVLARVFQIATNAFKGISFFVNSEGGTSGGVYNFPISNSKILRFRFNPPAVRKFESSYSLTLMRSDKMFCYNGYRDVIDVRVRNDQVYEVQTSIRFENLISMQLLPSDQLFLMNKEGLAKFLSTDDYRELRTLDLVKDVNDELTFDALFRAQIIGNKCQWLMTFEVPYEILDNYRISLWDINKASPTKLWDFSYSRAPEVYELLDDRLLTIAFNDWKVIVLDLRNGKAFSSFKVDHAIRSFKFDGRYLWALGSQHATCLCVPDSTNPVISIEPETMESGSRTASLLKVRTQK